VTIPTPEQQEAFLRRMPNAIVATIRRSGLPQLTPNWYLWTGEVFWISTASWTAKTHNLKRDPRVVLCIDDPEGGDYASIEGTATLLEGEAAREPSLELIRKYVDEPGVIPHWDRINEHDDRVVIVIRPVRYLWHDR
jgi:PPOX class probable F420-dependent enzyme